jgi:uncharacterized membrane protein
MKNPVPSDALRNPTQYNIAAISRLEHDALDRRTVIERISDAIARFIGSLAFLSLQVLFFVIWGAVNLSPLQGTKAFDPFPFGILALIVSSESVFLTIFVLISQNRMSRQSERRAHLDLQVSMLAEQELTTVLKMQEKICEHFGINIESDKKDVAGFRETTDVQKLASELEDKLPSDTR